MSKKKISKKEVFDKKHKSKLSEELDNPTAYFTGQQLLDLEGGPDTTGVDDEEDDTLPF